MRLSRYGHEGVECPVVVAVVAVVAAAGRSTGADSSCGCRLATTSTFAVAVEAVGGSSLGQRMSEALVSLGRAVLGGVARGGSPTCWSRKTT